MNDFMYNYLPQFTREERIEMMNYYLERASEPSPKPFFMGLAQEIMDNLWGHPLDHFKFLSTNG